MLGSSERERGIRRGSEGVWSCSAVMGCVVAAAPKLRSRVDAAVHACTLARLVHSRTEDRDPESGCRVIGALQVTQQSSAVVQGRDQARSMRRSLCGLHRIIVCSVAFLDTPFIVSSNTPLQGVGDNSEHG
jgi:hypothetical protein